MRALIVGGIGYIGSALIDEYRKRTDVEVDILDKRFIPHILADLPDNFNYVQGDMRDDKIIDPLLKKKPDMVYLLAAEVEAEKSVHKETIIWENNYEGIVKVVEKCPDESRLIFASTGNVFGGVNEDEKYMDLTEEDEPKPKYPYAESKRAVEKYLLESDRNYTICRFGTNYGYAPGIRFNLVTNNFIKKALTGETITIHGKGENYRPTVCVKDVARALAYLSEEEKAEGEIYHVVCENYKIRDLAQKIKSIISTTKTEHIAKDVPFSSYNLSSEKIKKLGFEFEWDVEKAVKEMINVFGCIKHR